MLFPLLLMIVSLKASRSLGFVLLLIIIDLSVLFYLNYKYPQLISSNSSEFIFYERMSSHVFALVFTFFIINSIFKAYQHNKLEAERSLNAKDAFLANMSHHIRTTLNGINGYSDLLLDFEIPVFEKKNLKF